MLHWVELGVAVLTVFVLWQVATLAPPAPPVAPAPVPAINPALDGLQFATRVPGRTAHSIDTLTVASATIPLAGLKHPVSVQSGDALTLVGWAAVGAAPARAIVGVIDGSSVASTAVDGDRPDIARALNSNAYEKTGFSLAIPTSDLMPGFHHLTFRIVTPDGTGYYDSPEQLSIFISPAGAARAQTVGFIDTIDGAPAAGLTKNGKVPRLTGPSLVASGWAIDWAHRTLLQSVSVLVDGKPVALARYRETRPGIAAYFKNDAYLRSGFSATVSLIAVRAGKHTIALRGQDIFGGESVANGTLSFTR